MRALGKSPDREDINNSITAKCFRRSNRVDDIMASLTSLRVLSKTEPIGNHLGTQQNVKIAVSPSTTGKNTIAVVVEWFIVVIVALLRSVLKG